MLIEHLEQFYRNQAVADNEKPRRWNRASSLGRCPRELAYTKLDIKGEPLTPRRMSIFDDGDFYDQKIKDDLIAALGGGIVALPYGSWPSVWIEGVEITGTPDFLIMPKTYPTIGLGEIKSMSNFAFDRAVSGHIDESYCCQAWTYAAQNALNPVVFVCIRKETRHICEVIFDKTAAETVVTKRYGGNELEIAANDPMLIAEVRSPFDASIEAKVRETVRSVRDTTCMDGAPIGIRSIEPETVSAQGKAKQEKAKAKYGEPVKVNGQWAYFETGRQILGFPCGGYCAFTRQCFPNVKLEINGGKPTWIVDAA